MGTRLMNGTARLALLAAIGMTFSSCDSGKSQGGGCTTGDERCRCYENDTCNDGLTCLSNICVATAGTGGTTSTDPSSNPDVGGTTGTGGMNSVTGGVGSDVGGSTATNGGTSAVLTAETGGANPTTGGAPPATGGVNAATGGANPATGGVNAATGGANPATGGVNAATGGANPATGGVSAATGGVNAATGGTTGASPYITQTDGWAVDPAHGVAGPIYTFTDPGGSRIFPDCSAGAECFEGTGPGTELCASGTAAKALDSDGYDCHLDAEYCDWASYWGAALALNPNQVAGSDEPSAWDASAYTGISFTIAIDAMPANLRIYLNLMDDTQYCYELSTSKTYTLSWSQFITNCYDPSTSDTSPSATALKQIKNITWQAGTNASQAKPFDFCVSNVKIN